MTEKIAASVEISPKQALGDALLPSLLPRGVRVYLTDVGLESAETISAGAKRLVDLGCVAVPHIACRRLAGREDLRRRIELMSGEAGVDDVLVIAGDLAPPAGEFSATMEVLETGLLDRYGIKHVGVAGHPEGSPDFSDETAETMLRLKQAFSERTDAKMRIVTQFGFNARQFIGWADNLPQSGISLPVHLGVAGPARLTTLIKFAAMCGVGESARFLKKRATSVGNMIKGFDPEEIVQPIEQHVNQAARTTIQQIHVFTFGGVKSCAQWLTGRGSWGSAADSAHWRSAS